ncbi:MAG: hypothetical protein PHC62_00360 [Candidatus Izemoplasmatales bacterium]|nr:hypothetical protein [Candidatus Izemoplasmatales bacterium]
MSKKPHVIDINTKSKRDIFFVAKNNTEATCIFKTQDFDAAMNRANQAKGTYYVYNSKGQIMYVSDSKSAQKEVESLNIHEGLSISAKGINVYSISSNTIPDSAYHGILHIDSPVMMCDKYKVRTEEEYPRYLWCKKCDIERYLLSHKK